MKRLYGLAQPEVELEVAPIAQVPASNASISMSREPSAATLRLVDGYTEASPAPARAPAPVAAVDADSFTPDFDRALMELQASMDVREETNRDHPEPFSERYEQDPLALSMSAESMGGSGGLIAWSKNLRPEDLSPDVTLASFLRPV